MNPCESGWNIWCIPYRRCQAQITSVQHEEARFTAVTLTVTAAHSDDAVRKSESGAATDWTLSCNTWMAHWLLFITCFIIQQQLKGLLLWASSGWTAPLAACLCRLTIIINSVLSSCCNNSKCCENFWQNVSSLSVDALARINQIL